MSLLNDIIELRNDTGGPISIGSLVINAGETIIVWDSQDYSLVNVDDLKEVVDNYNDFALNVSQSNLVVIKNSSDQLVNDAFNDYFELKKAIDEINQAQALEVALRKIKAIPSYLLGEVRPSLLGTADFISQAGSGWVLSNGQDVSGTPYSALTGKNTVPDMRGQFIRGKNNGRSDGYEDPEGERVLGEYQDDIFETHVHDYSDVGVSQTGLTSGATDFSNPTETVKQTASDSDGGGSETRPKNIAVNFFIYVGV